MILAIVSDIHGDAEALDACLARAQGADRLLCLGDAISQHRFANAVVARLRERGAICIQGNHEALFLGPGGVRAREAGDVDPDLLAWLSQWPAEHLQEFGRASAWLVHSAPWQTRDYVPLSDARLAKALAQSDADILLCGHTHQPGIRRIGDKLLLNPGSAGEGRPTDRGYVRSFAMIETETLAAEIVDLD